METCSVIYLNFVGKLVFHIQVMIDKDGWGGVWIPQLEVKFDDLWEDKLKRKHSSITLFLIKNESLGSEDD